MNDLDLINLWGQLRLLFEWNHRLAVSVLALRKLADESGFLERLMELEKLEALANDQSLAGSLRVIDGIIRKLRGA